MPDACQSVVDFSKATSRKVRPKVVLFKYKRTNFGRTFLEVLLRKIGHCLLSQSEFVGKKMPAITEKFGVSGKRNPGLVGMVGTQEWFLCLGFFSVSRRAWFEGPG